MARALTARVVAVLLAGGVVLGACGDEGPSEAEQVEAFCTATEPLPELSASLAAIPADASTEEAKATVVAFLDQLDEVLDAAPDAIRDEADRIRPVVDDVATQVEEATTTREIQTELSELVASLAQDADTESSVLGPLYLYVVENCPS